MTSQHTNNNIFQLQNSEYMLNALVTQSKLYSKAKKFSLVFFILYIVLPISYSLLTLIKCEWIEIIGAVITVVVTIISHRIASKSDKYRSDAARVQQTIDYNLFKQPEYQFENERWESLFSQSEVSELISNEVITQEDIEKKRNWYSDYSKHEHLKQIFYCQKMNVNWERELRKTYGVILTIIIVLSISIPIMIASLFNSTLSQFIILSTTFLPLIDYVYDIISGFIQDNNRIGRIMQNQNEIEGPDGFLFEGKELYQKEVQLQNMIYEHRKCAVLIPDFMYNIFQKKQQKKADRAASLIEKS